MNQPATIKSHNETNITVINSAGDEYAINYWNAAESMKDGDAVRLFTFPGCTEAAYIVTPYDFDHICALGDAADLARIEEDLTDYAAELETYPNDRAIRINIKDSKADRDYITGAATPKWATAPKTGIHSGDRAFTFNL